MIDQFIWLDHEIFIWLQEHLRGSFADLWIVLSRDKWFWLPVYVAVLTWIISAFPRRWYLIFLISLVLIVILDQGSGIIKKTIQRERPCRELYFKDHFQSMISCSGGFSFPSSHATNHAGLGVYIFLLMGYRGIGSVRYFFLIWPLWVSLAQVLVGVHFPIDVIFGLVTGSVIAIIAYKLTIAMLKKLEIAH
ncbi:MAG: phosphatase PAP2 family protein [Saprospiraceae bacterium]|nr:phosphatase PAP2 family protein [Saprospiraceae bacterium]HMW38066.1 phosphatase PAP2 family protein [Saprospiraceae bacterium]HMX87167.1 phosphatase PAP2 family protein [Saprospiraceae bacterium]HMZ38753.1 phosphatase PAP2 family protein [Saprospiraceae bacterium]HNA64189.1 phosphatase PAP2 family protein [Saprospiraceae bacterium]